MPTDVRNATDRDLSCNWSSGEETAKGPEIFEALLSPPVEETDVDGIDDDEAEGVHYVRILKNGQLVPNPEEIAAEAKAIRQSWSKAERLRRAGTDAEKHWTPPQVRAVAFSGELFDG